MYYLRVFIVFYNNYTFNVYCYYCGVFIVFTKFRLYLLLCELHGHVCPYIVIYGLRMFYKNYIVYCIVYIFVSSELDVAITSPSFVALYFLVSEIAKCIACGCLLSVFEIRWLKLKKKNNNNNKMKNCEKELLQF